MALKKDRIEIYRSRRNGEYGWRYIAKNGKRVAVAGETYKNLKHAQKMVCSLFIGPLATSDVAIFYDIKPKAKT